MTSSVPEGFTTDAGDNPFAELVGPIYRRPEAGGLSLLFLATDRHRNPRGVIHGGMLMTLMDNMLGRTISHVIGDLRKATLSLSCDFLSPAFPGQWIAGKGVVTKRTRSLVFAHGTLSIDDTPVLAGTGIWKLLSQPSAGNKN
jgi:acyl-coenzyme A thioesterase PaaI-like protein